MRGVRPDPDKFRIIEATSTASPAPTFTVVPLGMKARREPDRVMGAHPLLTELKEARRDRTGRIDLTHDAPGEIPGARPDYDLQ